MKVGLHVSISGSLDKAVDNAVKRECTAFQIFTRNPRGWSAKKLDAKEVSSFKDKVKKNDFGKDATVAHMPYLPNLSSPEEDGFTKSLKSLIEEAKRCDMVGVPYLVTHLGSHKGEGDQKGIDRLVDAFTKASSETPDSVTILLENTAGQKNSVGSDFAQLASIYDRLKPKRRFGICIDTCHAFAAGYDLRTKKVVTDTFDQFRQNFDITDLKVMHVNDCKGELGCNLDRHEHLGLGQIGEKGLAETVKIAVSNEIPMIMETPIDERRDDYGNMKKIKELAEK